MLRFFHWLFDHFSFLDDIALFLDQRVIRRRILNYRRLCNIHPTVVLGDVVMDKNVSIAEGTYYNSGQIFAGDHSKVEIGKYCAIGYQVHIKARSHDIAKTTRTSLSDTHLRKEADVVIGDNVWIGDNVFIGPGISIGDHAVIGANSVVTHNVLPFSVVGGVPARLIRVLDLASTDE